MASQPMTCANQDCNFAVDGKCVEAYALDECPHMSRITIQDIGVVDEAVATRVEATFLALELGDALTRAQASSLQTRRISRTVGIIAPNDAGKTSLLAGIYDLLQEGPVAGIGFAGSSTLIGFEKVCHDARVASRRDAPHTERTTQGAEVSFFHLDLRPTDGEIVALFISDRSGEDYLAASNELSVAEGFFELRRADVITLLVNGEHLTSSEHRHEAKAVTPQIIDALVEAGSFRKGCRLAIVLTKQDTVLKSPHADRVDREFNALADAIIASYGDHLGGIDRFVIAASPQDTVNLERGDGLDRLLAFWMRADTPAIPIRPAASDSTRMIDLLDSYAEVTA